MRSIVLLLVCIAALVSRRARAEQPPAGSPYQVNLALDFALTLGSGLASVVPFIFRNEVGAPLCGLNCDPSNVNALDRTVIGNYSPGAGLASDILFGANMAIPVLLDLIDVAVTKPGDRWAGYGKDLLVLAETAALDNLLNSAVKYAVRRPRPLVYDTALSAATRTGAGAGLSFYSGHASTSFALATAYSSLFAMRHPHSRLVIPVWVGTYLLAATTAVLRVESGEHFWTDVIVGGAVGSAVGLAVTHLHRAPTINKNTGTGGYALRVLPTALPGGAGLALALQEK